MQFIDNVRSYYFSNYNSLSIEKQFHFASRLYSWNMDSDAEKKLPVVRDYLLNDINQDAIKNQIISLFSSELRSNRIAHAERKPFFEAYSSLYGMQLVLFRARHLQFLYNVDIRNDIYNIIPLSKFESLKKELLYDRQALKFLSTYAISYCYLVDIVLHNKAPDFDIASMLEVGELYNLANATERQLLLYFYTHCIISDTNFYFWKIRGPMFVYHSMLEKIDSIIRDYYEQTSLDNKLEFLVCANICSFETNLRAKIYQECINSLDESGCYVIDKLNTMVRPERQSFDKSEHRNVLLIMSGKAYEPCSRAIG